MSQAFSVIGLGNWGTALAHHLARRGFDVVGWSANERITKGIAGENRNPVYLSSVSLDPRLRTTSDLQEALAADSIVLALPSHALGELAEHLPAISKNATIISGVKGVVGETLRTPLQYVKDCNPDLHRLVVLAGPCFARDLVMDRPAGIVAASTDNAAALAVAQAFSCATLKVYTSADPLGVEVGGIVKNVIALAAGVSDGLELGDSARVGLITRGLAEMTRLAIAMGGRVRTLSGLAGLGDLTMTATCDVSRNRTVGIRLGRGESLSQIVATLGSTAEAVTSTPLVLELARRYKVEMPITEAVAGLIQGRTSPGELAHALINRPLKSEFED